MLPGYLERSIFLSVTELCMRFTQQGFVGPTTDRGFRLVVMFLAAPLGRGQNF